MAEKSILLNSGSGGRQTKELIDGLFLKHIGNPIINKLTDAAILSVDSKKIAFTTDSFVVNPVFFPGGDIGKLSVCGTVNDLAVMGARPLYISLGIIIEEGLTFRDLEKIVISISRAAKEAGVLVVCGDTKVVEKGSADKIFINTSGIGVMDKKMALSKAGIKPGDEIIINGPIGDHGMAVLLEREGLPASKGLKSDCAGLWGLIKRVLSVSNGVKFMRDPTRGGLAATLNEAVDKKNFGIEIFEDKLPIRGQVKASCEILGFDPLYVANEGKAVFIVRPDETKKVLRALKGHALGRQSNVIGAVTKNPKGKVVLQTLGSGRRLVDMPSGSQLPRIC